MKKKVAFISEHASPLAMLGGVDSGGQNVYVARVASHLSQQGYEVDVFTRWDNPALDQIVDFEPCVRVIHIAAGPKEFVPKENLFQYMDEFASDMILFIERNNIHYELVHAHFWMSGYVAALIKNILNIPYVITFHALGKVRRAHQGSADGFPDERFYIEERVAKEADIVIAECPQDKEDLMIHYYVDEEKIRIIPCGFDKAEFSPIDKQEARARLGLKKEEHIVLQLGRMVKRKGVDTVVKAVGLLNKLSDLPVRLIIVGGESDEPDPEKTPEIGRLQQIAREENIEDKVTFIGRKSRSELKYFYNAADVFVTTPWYEPFGITPLEAMACGTPVIGSNVGGIKYSVEHCKTGFLVPPKEPEAVSKRLLELISDPSLLKKFSEEAIRRVNTMFTWETVSRDLILLYESITRKPVMEKLQDSLSDLMSFWKKDKSVKATS